jgi:hypothetical protein
VVGVAAAGQKDPNCEDDGQHAGAGRRWLIGLTIVSLPSPPRQSRPNKLFRFCRMLRDFFLSGCLDESD